MANAKNETCPTCKHSLVNNQHGFDQNDGYMEGDKLVLYGTCTYCRVCNPRLDALLREKGKGASRRVSLEGLPYWTETQREFIGPFGVRNWMGLPRGEMNKHYANIDEQIANEKQQRREELAEERASKKHWRLTFSENSEEYHGHLYITAAKVECPDGSRDTVIADGVRIQIDEYFVGEPEEVKHA